MKRAYTSLIIGGAGLLITGLLYYIVLRDDLGTTINWLSMTGVLLAEVITIVLALFTLGSPRRVAATGVSALGIAAAIALSLIFINSFAEAVVTFVLLYVVFTVGINALSAVLLRYGATQKAANDDLRQAKQSMLNLRKIVQSILADPASADIKADLEKVDEDLRFSNDAVIVPQDKTIYNLLTELLGRLQDPAFDRNLAIANLNRVIRERNIMTNRNG